MKDIMGTVEFLPEGAARIFYLQEPIKKE